MARVDMDSSSLLLACRSGKRLPPGLTSLGLFCSDLTYSWPHLPLALPAPSVTCPWPCLHQPHLPRPYLLVSVSSSSLAPRMQHSSFSFPIKAFWELNRLSSSAAARDYGKGEKSMTSLVSMSDTHRTPNTHAENESWREVRKNKQKVTYVSLFCGSSFVGIHQALQRAVHCSDERLCLFVFESVLYLPGFHPCSCTLKRYRPVLSEHSNVLALIRL